MSIKIALVTASKGTLLGHCLDTQVFARTVHTVITDRECGAEKIGQRHGVRVRRYEGCDNPELSSRIGNYCRENGVDYIISVFFPSVYAGIDRTVLEQDIQSSSGPAAVLSGPWLL